MKVSVVVPVYNGSSSIVSLTEKVINELGDHLKEIVLVNDGSPDNSHDVCKKLSLNSPLIKFISLRKNFGEHNAVMCGLNYVQGAVAVIIDDDFQNPPEEIMKLVKKLEEGYDVVYSYYGKKRHNLFRNIGSKLNNYFANKLLGKPKDLYLSSFKAIRKEIIPDIISYRGPFPYVDGLILRVTNNIGKVKVNHEKRKQGQSNYTLYKLISLYFNMFFNFSIKPLRIFTIMGFPGLFSWNYFLSTIRNRKILVSRNSTWVGISSHINFHF